MKLGQAAHDRAHASRLIRLTPHDGVELAEPHYAPLNVPQLTA
jgi:hypothetical protein